MPAFLGRVAEAVDDAVADLAAPGSRERLARRSASDELDARVLDQLPDTSDVFGVPEVPVEGQPAEVVPVRLGGFPVAIDRPARRGSRPSPGRGSGHQLR